MTEYLIGSVSSMSTTLPEPTVGGPPANNMMRAAQLPAGRHPAIMPAATCITITVIAFVCLSVCLFASQGSASRPDWYPGPILATSPYSDS